MPSKPVFLFAFANDATQSLRLDEEWRATEKALQDASDAGDIQFNLIPSTTKGDIWDKFHRFADQIALFHYGGHSDGQGLNLVDTKLHGENLATLLGLEKNLKLVFLNGCQNVEQVEVLFKQGVPLVIATTAPVADQRAVQLAREFYKSLTADRTIGEAFSVAAAFVNERQDQPLIDYRGIAPRKQAELEWGLYVNKKQALEWSIPKSSVSSTKSSSSIRSSNILAGSWKKYAAFFAGAIALLAGIAELSGYSVKDLFQKEKAEIPIVAEPSSPKASTTGDNSPAVITEDGDVTISYGETNSKNDSSNTPQTPEQ